MSSKSICVAIIALALFCSPVAQATLDPIKSTIEQAVNEALQKMLTGATTVTSTVGAVTQPIGALGQQVVNDYKAMGQTVLQAGSTLGQQFFSSVGKTGSQLGAMSDQIATLAEAYEAQFCTPASYEPPVKTPSTFHGPSFELILDSGSCILDEHKLLYEHQKVLTCYEPSVEFVKIPANFTSKHKTAPVFTGKECKIEKKFGEEERKVLYVFDGSVPVDMAALTANVMTEVRQALGMVTGTAHNALASQLQKFMSTLSTIPSIFNKNSGFGGFGFKA